MKERKKGPQKGAAKMWSQKLKEFGEQKPPKDLMEILNQVEKPSNKSLPTGETFKSYSKMI
jgi:hypothetical protein